MCHGSGTVLLQHRRLLLLHRRRLFKLLQYRRLLLLPRRRRFMLLHIISKLARRLVLLPPRPPLVQRDMMCRWSWLVR